MSLDRMDPDERGTCVACGRPWVASIASDGAVAYYCRDHEPQWSIDSEGSFHMNTPRESVSPETVLGPIEDAVPGISELMGAIIEAAFAPPRPAGVYVFSGINGATGRPFWHIHTDGSDETIAVQGQRGERCTRCMHVTLEQGAAGCCVSVEPTDVVVCPGCDMLYAAEDAASHFIKCFGGLA